MSHAILTVSEINEHKLSAIAGLCSVFERVTVVVDAKFNTVNKIHNKCNTLRHPALTVKSASYDHVRLKYGAKIDAFNGRWGNNPSKVVALECAAGMREEYAWIFEDDVLCRNWQMFASAYVSSVADLITTLADVAQYPWFRHGWLVGDSKHVRYGVAALYAFRVSARAAALVMEKICETKQLSHHEVFVPWAIMSAGLTQEALLLKHASTMSHNHSKRGDVGMTLGECEQKHGLIFHPVKTNVSRLLSRVCRYN